MSHSTEASEVSTGRRGRRAYAVLIGIGILVLAGLGAYRLYASSRESTDDAVVDADVVAVTARVAGVVSQVLVTDNATVKSGDRILQLDDADVRARLAQAQADLRTAQAQAAGAHAQVDVVSASARGGLEGAQAQVAAATAAAQSAAAQVTVADAALVRAKAEVEKADRDLARATRLVASDAIARQQMENAQLVADSAHAALQQATAAVTAATEARRSADSRVAEARARVSQTASVSQQVESARAAVALADARVASVEAAVHLAELQLSYTTVTAPADGVVTQLGARVGALVGAGQPLAQLVPAATYVVANFKETQIDAMRAGNRAEVSLDAYPGRRFAATLDSLSSGTGSRFSMIPPDNASGNFVKVVQRVPVRLTWDAVPDVPLKAGLSAEVTVFTATGR